MKTLRDSPALDGVRAHGESGLRPLRAPRYAVTMESAVPRGSGSASGVGRSRRPSPERPLVPFYTDALACALCGADGHGASECPRLLCAEAEKGARPSVDALTLAC